jgi:cobalt/nickel transport system permease protein
MATTGSGGVAWSDTIATCWQVSSVGGKLRSTIVEARAVHIPDGYLSPQTCAAAYVAALPTWTVAARRVTRVVKTRNVPLLAILSALCFLVMMFNIPIPDGTTAHAVGGVMIAIVLGPWAAVIAVTVALLLQALLFGDGGLLAFGANVVNMAIILPFVGYGVYRLIAGRAPLTAGRRITAAAIGGYCGINAAAFAAAIEFGIQPGLFHTASGAPLYSPYHLAQTIPAMMLAHLTIAGAAEAILTGGVFAYLVRADPRRLVANHPGIPAAAPAGKGRALTPARVAVGFIALMILLTPLGLLAPGGAFGEDGAADLDAGALGLATVPTGLARYNGFWSHAVLGGYGFKDGQHARLGYVLSAIVGIAIIAATVFAVGKVIGLVVRRRSRVEAEVDVGEPSRV